MNKAHASDGFSAAETLLALAVIGVLVAVGVLVQARRSKTKTISPKSTQSVSIGSQKALMVVGYTGGLCADGNVCSSSNTLYDNGNFDKHLKLTSTELSDLKTLVSNTDFLSYPQNPQPTCPSYSDGSDLSLAFPQKYPDKNFTLCELQIPASDKVFSSITTLIDKHAK